MNDVNSRPQPPAQIRWAGLIAIAQSAIALAFAAFLIYRDVTGAEERSLVSDSANIAWVGTGTAVFFILIFGSVIFGSVWMMRGHKWGRGPIVLLEIIFLGIAYFMASAGAWIAAVATAASALAALVFLFNRHSVEWAESSYRS